MKLITSVLNHQKILLSHYFDWIILYFGSKSSDGTGLQSYLYGWFFIKCANSRNRYNGQKHRFRYEKSRRIFVVEEDEYLRYFYDTTQNYKIFKNGINNRAETLFRAYLLDSLQLQEGATIIDCGANIGDFELAVQRKIANYKYFAFEPSPTEFACLKQNSKSNNCFNYGLWNETTEIEFYISTENADSSSIQPTKYTEKILVPAKRLDSSEFNFGKINLLKLEAEGAEIEVILGASGILKNIQYISADLGFERQDKSTLPEVSNYLLSNNFEIIDFGFPRIVVLFRNKNFNLGNEG